MPEASAIDADLTRLARRFIAETCDFLTENWNVQREWWPLRAGGRRGLSVSGCDASPHHPTEAPAAAPRVLRAVQVVSMHAGGTEIAETGLTDTHLFVLVPCARNAGVLDARIQATIAQSPTGDGEDPWQIWVPETIAAPSSTIRAPVRMSIAG